MRLGGAHRSSNINAQLSCRVWQDLDDADNHLCSQIYMVKSTLKFVLDFPTAREHAEPTLEALAKSVGSVGRRFGSRLRGRRTRQDGTREVARPAREVGCRASQQ